MTLVPKPQERIRASGVARVGVSTGAVLLWLVAAHLRDFGRAALQVRAGPFTVPIACLRASVAGARLGVTRRKGRVAGAPRVVEGTIRSCPSRPTTAHNLWLDDLDVLADLGLRLRLDALQSTSLVFLC